ncbi:hypothetical protein LEAN103870_09675 [Legionella anisa]|uniref:Type IV secretion protein Dot n=1 Tax=Legionella anisa TaxID=28082 RepID=A0AAX0WX57_9GAMM|nr:hypothetical protein [Legionella anisa]AWN73330.1 hypothetical protein DLD14_05450 [Legionella anisa]KTC69855.1 hypothetical protein Lani_2561 [Legionella anisa]MBN5934111.1 hypothetical protein [Legionella anisa]MCW8426190.1 hypothetical protein [Legionella anisa]MCW8447852.1 hypothetical protein [Legionella anisa]
MFNKTEKIGKKQSSNDLTRDIPLSRSPESLIDKIKADKKQYELTDVGVPLTSHGFLSSKRSRSSLKEEDFQASELEIILEESSEEEATKSEFTY